MHRLLLGGLFIPLTLAGQGVRDLQIDLRIEVEDGPAQPIGELRDFTVLAGRTFVLDFKEQVVHVFGPVGTFERTTGRKGSGPGEFRNANGLLAAPDGTVWVNDPGNARLTVLNGDGTFQRHHTFTANMYGFRWEGVFDDQKRLRVMAFNVNAQNDEARTLRLDLSARVLDTMPTRRVAVSPGRTNTITIERADGGKQYRTYPFRVPAGSAFDPQGFSWGMAGVDEYRVEKRREDGVVVASGERRIPATPIPEVVRNAEIKALEKLTSGAVRHDADFSRIPRHFAFVQQLAVDDQSRLWARRVLADSTRSEFDVFTPDGKFLWSARVAARLAPFGRLIVRDGALHAVALDDDDLPTIIRARIPR